MNKQRFYPDVSSVEDAKTAIHQLTDHLYELRDQMDAHKQQLESHKSMIASADQKATEARNKANAPTLDIAGIQVNAATDSISLQNGFTVRYDNVNGRFNFGT